jgi:hypothetical protein
MSPTKLSQNITGWSLRLNILERRRNQLRNEYTGDRLRPPRPYCPACPNHCRLTCLPAPNRVTSVPVTRFLPPGIPATVATGRNEAFSKSFARENVSRALRRLEAARSSDPLVRLLLPQRYSDPQTIRGCLSRKARRLSIDPDRGIAREPESKQWILQCLGRKL